ncbi:MAG: cellulose biosynthesis protein BcsQ [Terracidiphilus sp.]|jgi:cellulose synthase operon protein YhjQ
MTDRKALGDQNETPEDVATLYSWANLHGAKYRDFSASRAQTREKARLRVQEAIEEERRRAREEAEAQKATETARAGEAARQAESIAQQEAQQAAHLAAQQAQQRAWQPPRPDRFSALAAPNIAAPAAPYSPAQPVQPDYPGYTAPPAPRPGAGQQPYAPVREENYSQPRSQWAPADARDNGGRPAWLAADRAEGSNPSAIAQAPEDTLQGSRDRLTSRWFALKNVFEGASAPAEPLPAQAPARVPVLAVFSLAGGVGKTSLVATLGRALSARGERVLLVDTAAYGLLPFFFGARDQRPGMLRTFSPPGASGDAPIQMVTIDPETLGPETAAQETLTQEIGRYSRGASRVIVDLATASAGTTRRVLRMSPMVLVPVIPDMNSVVSVSSIDAFFQRNSGAAGSRVQPYYVLNQFDPSLPLHLDVREVLREQLGDRLLPFALRRTPAVSEALAEGMTVVDYAPNSTVAEDFGSLAGWVKSLSAPATTGYRGVRWSER